MKKTFLQTLMLCCGVLLFNTGSFAQSCFTVNNPTLSCTVPCATLTVVPSIPTLAATTSYAVSSVPYTPYSYTGGSAAIGVGQDDIWSGIVNLPFYFCFFGNSYNRIVIGANGQVSFDVTRAGAFNDWVINNNTGLPNAPNTQSTVRNAILSPYYDINPAVSGTIRYQTIGVAPCRVFVVSWNNVALYSCTSKKATQQIVLYESTNVVDINIGNKPVCGSWNGGRAITGIDNNNSTLFYTAPGQNGGQFTVANQSWRFTPTGTVSPWVYTWTGPGGVIPGNTPQLSVCPTVTTVYTVVATNTACTNLSVQLTPTVTTTNFLPPITGPASICKGSTSAVTDAAAGGVWSSSNPSVATINSGNGTVYGVSAGSTTLTYTNAGCMQFFTLGVIDPSITPPSSVCPGGITTLVGSPAGGTWASLNTGVATVVTATGDVTGVAPGTTTIVYTVGPGCTASTPLNVFALAPITGDTVFCQGTTTTLSNVTGGTWSSGNLALATIDIASGVVYGISPGDVPITYSLAGGCRVFSSVHIDPVMPITGTASLCQRGTTTLSNGIGGGVWAITPSSIATINPVTGEVFGVTPGSGGNATATYLSPYGCVSTIPVTVHPTPAPPTTSPGEICQFFPALPLVAYGGSGATYTWYGTGVTPGYSVAPTPSTTVPGIDTYYVTQTSTFGCVSDSSRVTFKVKPKPVAPVTVNKEYCEDYESPTPLEQQVTATGTLNWYNPGYAPLGGIAPEVKTDVVTYPNGIIWHVSQTIDGCEGDTADVKVTIINIPDFHITTRPWVCQFDSMSLEYTADGAALVDGGYLWVLPEGASFANGSSDTDATIYVQFDSSGNHNQIILTADNLNGQCFSSDTVDIKVVQQPTAAAKSRSEVCMSDTTTLALSARSSGAADFVWFIDNTPLFNSGAVIVTSANSNNGGPFQLRWIEPGIHFITMQTFTEEGCASKPVADTILVHALPDATFTYDPPSGTLCLEDSILFVANDSGYQNKYLWEPEHSFHNLNRRSIYGRMEETESVITLTVTDPFGCVATYNRVLNPQPCCVVPFPNAFTPNGDGLNDVFRAVPTGAFHRFHMLRIANRWGQTLFSSTDNTASWDGTYNGVPQDAGVYYYYVKFDCNGKTIEQKGDCTLIR